MVKKVFSFIKKNKCITVFFAISLFIIISYIVTMDWPELFDGAEEWYNLCFQFSIGYIINFMFYITQVYIPNSNRDATVRACIKKRISQLIQHMDSLLFRLAEKYIEGHKEHTYTEEDFKTMLNFRLSDKVNVLNANLTTRDHYVYFSVREWIRKCMAETEKDIDNLFKYYAPHISVDLMETLESIPRTMLYSIMDVSLNARSDFNFSGLGTELFADYYQLLQKLEKTKENDYS